MQEEFANNPSQEMNGEETVNGVAGEEATEVRPRGEREEIYSWQAPEYVYHEKTKRWYWFAAGAVAIILVLAAILQNFLMGVTFVLLAIVVYIYSKKQPRIVDFKLLGGGIEADGIFYDYDTMKSFWIFYNNPPHDAYISIQRSSKYKPYLQLPLGESGDPVEIRNVLLNFTKEQKHQEEFVTIIERLIKF